MELIKELQKQEHANSTGEHRNLGRINAGKYKMSIQGSGFHYCSPRETLPVDLYTSMELALFNKKGWLHINRSKVLKAFPRYNELCERVDSLNSSCPVFGWVPIDLLNDLYLYLKKY
jgi:hypothetical protein